jgi:hypothetical protein
MQRRAGLRQHGAPQPPPVVPAPGRGGGRNIQQPAVVPAIVPILPPPVVQPVLPPPGPLPPNLPAIIPPLPGDPIGDFDHILEFIIGLDTQAKRD